MRPGDFREFREELAKTNGLVSLGNHIRHVRMIFGYAYKADLIDRPVKFGPDFGITLGASDSQTKNTANV